MKNEMTANVKKVLSKLDWMREQRIWPNGMRYLWTDAFGVVLLVSLYHELRQNKFLDEAQRVVADVERVLGRRRGFRIGEAADRDGQYFHYLAMWIFALSRLGKIVPEYRAKAIQLVKDIHPAFVIPGRGVHWKMLEDLSAPYPGFGLGRARSVPRIRCLPAARRRCARGRNPADENHRRTKLSGPGHHAGPRSWNDALDDALLSRRALGARSPRAESRDARPDVDRSAGLLSAASWERLRSNLHSPTLASRSASRPLTHGRSASRD